MTYTLVKDSLGADILIDSGDAGGILHVSRLLAGDIELVCGVQPSVRTAAVEVRTDAVLIAGIAGQPGLLADLEAMGNLSLVDLRRKRESYQLSIVENPFPRQPAKKKAFVIAGSDKRGCIYGLLSISERIGVTPMVWIGDVIPEKKPAITIELFGSELSKESSVRYRGFFINDEWPAFGNWCTEKFGGVNAKAYEKILELLLRLKGNYPWQAMWNSSFSQDGPGLANAELAHELGVIMGASHHEPMCRAGVEWQRQYTNHSSDNSWDFTKTRQESPASGKRGLSATGILKM